MTRFTFSQKSGFKNFPPGPISSSLGGCGCSHEIATLLALRTCVLGYGRAVSCIEGRHG